VRRLETSSGKLRSISEVFGKDTVFMFALRPDRHLVQQSQAYSTGRGLNSAAFISMYNIMPRMSILEATFVLHRTSPMCDVSLNTK
jgi:hypothetical protein